MDSKARLKATVGPGTGTRSSGGVGSTAPTKPTSGKLSPRARGRAGSPSAAATHKKFGATRAQSTIVENRAPSPERLAAAMRSFSVDGLGQPVLDDATSSGDDPLKKYRVGETVLMTRDRIGKIKYIGRTHFAKGPWFGIELTDKSVGNHDGMVGGRRYFKCAHKRGLFVQKKKIRKRISGKRRLIKMFAKASSVKPELVQGEWQIWREGEKGSRVHMCDMEVNTNSSGDLYGQVRTGGELGVSLNVKKRPLRAEVRGKLPMTMKHKLTFTILWKPGQAMDDVPVGLTRGASPPPKAKPPEKKSFLKRSSSRSRPAAEKIVDSLIFSVTEINEETQVLSGTYKRSKENVKGNTFDKGEFVAAKKNSADIKSVFSEI